jgi:hypothetical protein
MENLEIRDSDGDTLTLEAIDGGAFVVTPEMTVELRSTGCASASGCSRS